MSIYDEIVQELELDQTYDQDASINKQASQAPKTIRDSLAEEIRSFVKEASVKVGSIGGALMFANKKAGVEIDPKVFSFVSRAEEDGHSRSEILEFLYKQSSVQPIVGVVENEDILEELPIDVRNFLKQASKKEKKSIGSILKQASAKQSSYFRRL